MSDLRKIAINSPSAHRNATGNGFYNRFEPLASRPRLPSQGKRQLSPGTSQPTFKFPRLDANKVFDQLKGQDSFLDAARTDLETAKNAVAASCKPDDGGMGTALFKLTSVLTNLIEGNESLKSAIVDLFKSNSSAPDPQSADPPPTVKGTGKGNPGTSLSLQVPKSFNFTNRPLPSPPRCPRRKPSRTR